MRNGREGGREGGQEGTHTAFLIGELDGLVASSGGQTPILLLRTPSSIPSSSSPSYTLNPSLLSPGSLLVVKNTKEEDSLFSLPREEEKGGREGEEEEEGAKLGARLGQAWAWRNGLIEAACVRRAKEDARKAGGKEKEGALKPRSHKPTKGKPPSSCFSSSIPLETFIQDVHSRLLPIFTPSLLELLTALASVVKKGFLFYRPSHQTMKEGGKEEGCPYQMGVAYLPSEREEEDEEKERRRMAVVGASASSSLPPSSSSSPSAQVEKEAAAAAAAAAVAPTLLQRLPAITTAGDQDLSQWSRRQGWCFDSSFEEGGREGGREGGGAFGQAQKVVSEATRRLAEILSLTEWTAFVLAWRAGWEWEAVVEEVVRREGWRDGGRAGGTEGGVRGCA